MTLVWLPLFIGICRQQFRQYLPQEVAPFYLLLPQLPTPTLANLQGRGKALSWCTSQFNLWHSLFPSIGWRIRLGRGQLKSYCT